MKAFDQKQGASGAEQFKKIEAICLEEMHPYLDALDTDVGRLVLVTLATAAAVVRRRKTDISELSEIVNWASYITGAPATFFHTHARYTCLLLDRFDFEMASSHGLGARAGAANG